MIGIEPKTVAIVVPQGAQSLDVSGPLDAFLEANRQAADQCHYQVRLLSTGADRVARAGGMSLLTDGSILEEDGPIDTLLVAGTPDHARACTSTALHDWLRRRTPEARRYGSVCTGAFFLGAAGLLDGRSATTHWQHAAELAQRFPAAHVMPDRIFVEDGALWTSAGVTAGIDLALKLIEDDPGREIALTVARPLVVFLKRPGGQSQEAGATPAEFVEMTRIDSARRLLEDSDTPLQRVASRCGFANPDTMRRAFLRSIGTGPSEYRERFRR